MKEYKHSVRIGVPLTKDAIENLIEEFTKRIRKTIEEQYQHPKWKLQEYSIGEHTRIINLRDHSKNGVETKISWESSNPRHIVLTFRPVPRLHEALDILCTGPCALIGAILSTVFGWMFYAKNHLFTPILPLLIGQILLLPVIGFAAGFYLSKLLTGPLKRILVSQQTIATINKQALAIQQLIAPQVDTISLQFVEKFEDTCDVYQLLEKVDESSPTVHLANSIQIKTEKSTKENVIATSIATSSFMLLFLDIKESSGSALWWLGGGAGAMWGGILGGLKRSTKKSFICQLSDLVIMADEIPESFRKSDCWPLKPDVDLETQRVIFIKKTDMTRIYLGSSLDSLLSFEIRDVKCVIPIALRKRSRIKRFLLDTGWLISN